MCNSAVVSIDRYEFPYPSPAAVAEHPFDSSRLSSLLRCRQCGSGPTSLHQLMDRRRACACCPTNRTVELIERPSHCVDRAVRRTPTTVAFIAPDPT